MNNIAQYNWPGVVIAGEIAAATFTFTLVHLVSFAKSKQYKNVTLFALAVTYSFAFLLVTWILIFIK